MVATLLLQVEPLLKHIKNTYPTVQLIMIVLPGKTPIYGNNHLLILF